MSAEETKRKIRVCVVEDEEMILEMYQKKLESDGFEVFVAVNGVEGFDVIQKNKPDIALIDIMMPEQDGINLITQLRKDPEMKKLPVIILTNIDEKKTIERTYDLDVAFYLVKAKYQPSDVSRIVKEVLGSQHITAD